MARVIDEKGRLFGKVSVVDLVVLIVIVALAVFIGLRVSGNTSGTAVETVPVKIIARVSPSDVAMVDGFMTLGPITDAAGRSLGTIVSAEIAEPDPLKVSFDDSVIGFNLGNVPDVWIEIAAEGHVANDGAHVGSTVFRVGTDIDSVGPGWEGWIHVLSVEPGTTATE